MHTRVSPHTNLFSLSICLIDKQTYRLGQVDGGLQGIGVLLPVACDERTAGGHHGKGSTPARGPAAAADDGAAGAEGGLGDKGGGGHGQQGHRKKAESHHPVCGIVCERGEGV